MAPFTLHRNLLTALASRSASGTGSGKPARIIAKMNALTDEATITRCMRLRRPA